MKFSITKSITNQNGENFKIGDIVNVIYNEKYSYDEQECRGRLSSINDVSFLESIAIDCSNEMNSNTKCIDLHLIKSIKMA